MDSYVDLGSHWVFIHVSMGIKSWQDKRINAINRKISRVADKQAMTEKYIDEHWKICNSQANNKRGYKDECKKETC